MLENREGQRVPPASFRTRTESGEWKTLGTDDIFKGKTVVVFSLPGAFTPTCSSTHVPRYNELAPAFFANGVDRVVCISVNDAFVMNEWARTQECGNVLMLPDGNGEFSARMGMLVDKSELGFGKRSWRYSMLVKDGMIEKMFIEPEKPGDPFEVSDADTMLDYINPKAKKPDQVAILTREGCGYCAKAKALLKQLGYQYGSANSGRLCGDECPGRRGLRPGERLSSPHAVADALADARCVGAVGKRGSGVLGPARVFDCRLASPLVRAVARVGAVRPRRHYEHHRQLDAAAAFLPAGVSDSAFYSRRFRDAENGRTRRRAGLSAARAPARR